MPELIPESEGVIIRPGEDLVLTMPFGGRVEMQTQDIEAVAFVRAEPEDPPLEISDFAFEGPNAQARFVVPYEAPEEIYVVRYGIRTTTGRILVNSGRVRVARRTAP